MDGASVTALIGAYEPGPGGLRALTPLAGLGLVEHQARRAIAAGADRVLLLIDAVPPGLAAAVAGLRQDGMSVALAPGIDAAADALADRTVLLIADACLPAVETLAALIEAPVPSLATLADTPEHSRYERIDAEVRWAGAALLDGHRVAETAAMLGSWDPVSTLLRRAVQEGATRIAADATPPLLLVESEQVAAAERGIIAATRVPAVGWPERFLFAPAEELALPFLLERQIGATPLVAAAAGLSTLAAMAGWFGWDWVALVLLILSGPIAAAGARLGRVRSRPALHAGWLERVRIGGAALAGIGLAKGLAAQSGQWGWGLVMLIALLAMAARGALARLVDWPRPIWLASVDALIWAMLPFALVGRWGSGLLALGLYAGVSGGWLLRLAIRDKEKG